VHTYKIAFIKNGSRLDILAVEKEKKGGLNDGDRRKESQQSNIDVLKQL
jgi:hypothetical protein